LAAIFASSGLLVTPFFLKHLIRIAQIYVIIWCYLITRFNRLIQLQLYLVLNVLVN
jgi:hypothetical protein